MMDTSIWETLRILFVEQTTADEVIVFLVICVVLALLFAFLLYTLILAALWRHRLRGVTTLRELLFPGRDQVMSHLGEYLLAGATSVLLTLTVAARHDAVAFVLDYPLYEVDSAAIQQAFPFGGVGLAEMVPSGDEASELAVSLAAVATRTQGDRAAYGLPSIGVEALLLPTAAAGGADHASLWLRALVDRLDDDPWQRFPTERHLLTLAIFLLLAYVGWFAFGRTRTAERAGGAGGTDYARVVGRLLVPAVCVALLLLSAIGAGDPERITRSAVAAAGLRLGPDEERAARYFAAAMSQQLERGQLVRYLVAGQDSVPSTLSAIARLEEEIGEVRGRAADLARADAEARLRLEAMLADLRRAEARIARDSARTEGELSRLDQRAQTMEEGVRRAGERLTVIEREVGGARNRADEAVERAQAAERSVAALEASVRALAARMPTSGMLLVVTAPQVAYEIRAGGVQGPVRGRGFGIGLHALPPGDYSITGEVGSTSRTISTGAAETVRLERLVSSVPPTAAPATVRIP